MDKPLTTRLPEEFVIKIKEIAKKENLDTSAIIRRLLARALEEEKFKFVLENLSKHKISIGRVAEELNVSIWDVIDIAKENNIDWVGLTLDELEEQLKMLNSTR